MQECKHGKLMNDCEACMLRAEINTHWQPALALVQATVAALNIKVAELQKQLAERPQHRPQRVDKKP